MNNYPAGADNDPSAPWNLKDPVMMECDDCAGSGQVMDEDDGLDYACEHCGGTGEIDEEENNLG